MHELDALGAPGLETIALASLSDAGRVRAENQDAVALLENTSRERLLLVADGMGGHRGGETASRICVQIAERSFREPHGTPDERLRRGLELANEEIYSHALAHPELRGMGTTVVAALVAPDGRAWVAWAGDSRCYRLRAGLLELLTRDHSLMTEWISIGVITPEAAETHPRRHELTRALGQSPDVAVDLVEVPLRPGDRLLLCSDGLHGYVAERALKLALARGTPEEVTRALVDAANAAGGSDNVSVVVVALPASSAAIAEPLATVAPAVEETARELAGPPPELDFAPAFDLAPELAPEPEPEPAPLPAPVPELTPEPPSALEPPPEASFADLETEIAEVVADSPIESEVAAIETAPTPEREPGFPPPSAQRIQIPLMTPVASRRGFDATSLVAGAGGTLALVALCIGVWLYTGSRSANEEAAAPRPISVHAAKPAPRTRPAAPQPAAEPPAAPVPAEVAKPPVLPEIAPAPVPVPQIAKPPAALAARAAAPVAPPRAAHTTASAPAAAALTPAAPPASAAGFELTPEVERFVNAWLAALEADDRVRLAALGFAEEPAAFAGTPGTRDGFRLVAASIDEERSQAGRVYLRLIVSYAFRDANGRFRTQDEQRLILRAVAGRLRFEGRWQ